MSPIIRIPPSVDVEDFQAVRLVLISHRGHDRAITQAKLADACSFLLASGEPDVRRVQLVLQHYRRDFPLPVVSSGRGVFLAETAEEVNEYFEQMNSRHAAETETMLSVRDVAISAGMIQLAPWKLADPAKREHQSEIPMVLTDPHHAEVIG